MAGVRKPEKTPAGRKDLTVSHRARLITELRGAPELVAMYFNAAVEDGPNPSCGPRPPTKFSPAWLDFVSGFQTQDTSPGRNKVKDR